MKVYFIKINFSLFIIFLLTAAAFAQTEREKGIELYENGNYKEAVENLQKVIETGENDGEAWRFLGMAHFALKNYKQARKAFDNCKQSEDVELNKTYDKLLKISFKSHPKYTMEARRNLTSGKVILAVEFGRDGKIGRIFPYKTLLDGLTESAVSAAGKMKFEPALRNGKSVTVIKFVEYDFMTF